MVNWSPVIPLSKQGLLHSAVIILGMEILAVRHIGGGLPISILRYANESQFANILFYLDSI